MERTFALRMAAGFFLIWLAILYAGADHPPPAGFVWVVLADLLAAILLYFRAPAYLARARSGTWSGLPGAALEGMAVGLVFALVFWLSAPTGEPTIRADWIDVAVWHLVVGSVGTVTAIALYLVCVIAARMPPQSSKHGA